VFELPERIEEILSSETEVSDRIKTLKDGLNVFFSELIYYWDYVQDNTQFSTHQGVKGLEYDRVSVIMDDENAGGNFFSYEKLFGAKLLSKTDVENQKDGKDDAISRTMRLFYVTCTRAIESLAIIAYTSNMEAVKKTAISNGWFSDDEVIIMGAESI
jgi:DNA helicase-2/ATP-dependent DNA helicase PcrA